MPVEACDSGPAQVSSMVRQTCYGKQVVSIRLALSAVAAFTGLAAPVNCGAAAGWLVAPFASFLVSTGTNRKDTSK